MTIENEITITTHKTGQVYLEEGWYEYEVLEDLIEANKRHNERLIMELRESTKKMTDKKEKQLLINIGG